MIERLQLIASFLHRIRLLIIGAGLLFLLAFSLSLFGAGGFNSSEHLIPALVGFVWAVTGYSCANVFLHVPPPPAADCGFLERWRIKLRRGFYWILALLMLGLTISVVILSYELLRTWSMA